MNQNNIVIISGPTASGKSDLAIKIASELNGVVINADSMQLYKELPILSAQPKKEEMFHVKHFLYSVLNHDDESSLGTWLKLATKIIDEQRALGKLPIVVGGTGLYLSKLIGGLNSIPQIDEIIRKESRELYDKIEKNEFVKIITALGEEADKVANLDKQRLMRRFEVLKQTGKSLDWWQKQPKQKFYKDSDFMHINLEPNREQLYKNCDLRFESIFTNGSIEEAQDLARLDPADDLPIVKTIGYIEIKDYLNGNISQEEVIQKACQKTRNYAKRQLTWFKNQFKNKIVFDNSSYSLKELIKKIKDTSPHK